jgi:hypothetical protein
MGSGLVEFRINDYCTATYAADKIVNIRSYGETAYLCHVSDSISKHSDGGVEILHPYEEAVAMWRAALEVKPAEPTFTPVSEPPKTIEDPRCALLTSAGAVTLPPVVGPPQTIGRPRCVSPQHFEQAIESAGKAVANGD